MVNTVVYNYYYNHEWFLELMVNTTQIATFTVFFIFKFNSLPNAKILNLTKLKAFADDILNVKKWWFLSMIEWKTLWEKEKMLSNSIFYFSLSVFQSHLF